LKKELELENGVLCYHLDMMEKEQIIRSVNVKNKVCYYLHPHTTDTSFSDSSKVQLQTAFQQNVINAISQKPGITQKELVKTLKSNKRVMSYHINILLRDGVIKVIKEGRNCRYYKNPN